MLAKRYFLCLSVLFLVCVVSIPIAAAAGWSTDVENKATGQHSTQIFTDQSDISDRILQINSPNGSYMYYTETPKTDDWKFSVDVNAQVFGGFFICAVSHLPMIGHYDGFGCGISPYDGQNYAFEESATAVFDNVNYYQNPNWTGGYLAMGQFHLNTWYTLVITISNNASHFEMAAYNETGSFMGRISGAYGDDALHRVVDGYLGFGAGANGGNYTVRNVHITTNVEAVAPSPYPEPSVAPSASPSAGPSNTPSDAPAIKINTQCVTVTSGFKVLISGNLVIGNKEVADAALLLSYSVNNGSSWNELTTVVTDSQGGFLADWRPNVSGNYLLKASYSGTVYAPTSSVVSFVLLPATDQNVFSVTSNSTISGFAFNSTSSELSFTASGPSGTRGYAQVSIAKSMVSSADGLAVLIDGNPVKYTSEGNGDFLTLTFEYFHSTHQVVVCFEADRVVSLQAPNLWILVSIVAILSVVLVGICYRVTKTRGNPSVR
jgi:hypothetical protein